VTRLGFVMRVHPEQHAEYERRHAAIWPDLAAALRAHGVLDYTIWLDRRRSLLFAHVVVASRERWDAIAATPVCQRWWAYMKDVMETNPDASPVSEELQDVFHLAAG
jgi:L-rhamnose mutarotase